MTIENTLDEREKTHGKFETQANISMHLKDVIRSRDNYESLSDCQREALDMIMHKVARILNGNPNFTDHWHDIAGYATLVEKTINEKEEVRCFEVGQRVVNAAKNEVAKLEKE